MANKAERLAQFIKGLRGTTSQRRFSQQLGVSKSCVNFWESGLAFPDTGNLEKLAALKGWTLAELQTYLVKGELPSDDTLQQIITKLRSLPTEAVAQVASAAVETLASRSQSVQAVIK
ncbi:helix-turn-helix transcriptional regulator [Calothrix sp. FACHB-1219]|uniref:helix-turn-helix domain-containing protein n=1 Tax=unclassified Calothrix TaxID=2619626 RepID=UPI00168287AB|nr:MULTISPECIES: helix-turn-helix transcriptional regulator [unclassified Calothrix]MBD2206602.1 helix-turn-helix transcriptional regulator [Calothrix sp. FACHB-168]MBD2221397.1 helix-turn-helix transcriptional regulator [Calothrix sp. FACHB-1219]